MKILVINSGSSSIKYTLFQMTNGIKLASGIMEKVGTTEASIHHQVQGKEKFHKYDLTLDYQAGINMLFQLLVDPEQGVLNDVDEIKAVGHRVVHGGEFFAQAAMVNDDVLAKIEKVSALAPLHNPANLEGIRSVRKLLPHIKQVVVFDTAFHQTMPDHAFLYGLPEKIYDQYQVRRYGFHGTSHAYVSKRAASFLAKPLTGLKMITCHMGNGVSLTAINQGISIDTSMGMTPLEGVMMGTRSGSIDPAVIPFLMKQTGKTVDQILQMLNEESGLLGVSGISNDMRELIAAMEQGDANARLAIEMYVYQIRKMIGAYVAVLNGLDVLVFTAGIGENAVPIREKICLGFDYLGLQLDQQQNQQAKRKECRISAAGSKVEVLMIPTDEEQMIAEETKALVERKLPC